MEKTNSYSVKYRLKKNKWAYIMLIPVVLYYFIFHYIPMFGIVIAFKDYTPFKGIIGSEWAGLKHFISFFNNMYFWRLIRNTVLISFYDLLFNFPAPVILALLFNEVRNRHFKRTVQTISYFPHFISLVVMCGMIRSFTLSEGIITNFLVSIAGIERESLLQNAKYFRAIYVLSSTWKEVGWNSIIYMAALSGINTELYESCEIDGGGKWRKAWHVTLPGIRNTIILLFILRTGALLSVGSEKIILLYNSSTYETADVISSFLYRKGLQEQNWSYGATVGLFNALINMIFIVLANTTSRKFSETSLW